MGWGQRTDNRLIPGVHPKQFFWQSERQLETFPSLWKVWKKYLQVTFHEEKSLLWLFIQNCQKVTVVPYWNVTLMPTSFWSIRIREAKLKGLKKNCFCHLLTKSVFNIIKVDKNYKNTKYILLDISYIFLYCKVYLQTLFGYFWINLASLLSCFEIITEPKMRKGASSYLSKSNWKTNYSFTTAYLSALMFVAP